MPAVCQVVPANGVLIRDLIAYVDCEARALGAGGYAALIAPGSSVSLALVSFVALFVALFGYRLLLGSRVEPREGILAVVKLGIVLALATAWPAYQVLVYDLVLVAPAELAAEVSRGTGGVASTNELVSRLDVVDQAFSALSRFGAGTPSNELAPLPVGPFQGFDALALSSSRGLFLVGALGAFAFLRLAAGFLLALGPLFIAFLLFEGTRSLFEGWARALAGLALAATAAALILGVELGLLEPWLAFLLDQRRANLAILEAPGQLLAVTLVFALVPIAVTILTLRVAMRLHFALVPDRNAALSRRTFASIPRPIPLSTATAEQSRGLMLTHSINEAIERNERHRERRVGVQDKRVSASGRQNSSGGDMTRVPTRVVDSRDRRGRVSGSAIRRDARR